MDNFLSVERGQSVLDEMAGQARVDATEGLSQTVPRLARLQPIEYEQVRETEAQRLGVRVTALDKAVIAARRAEQFDGGKPKMFPTVTPWVDPVDGAELLSEIHATIKRFIVCEDATAVAATLWLEWE